MNVRKAGSAVTSRSLSACLPSLLGLPDIPTMLPSITLLNLLASAPLVPYTSVRAPVYQADTAHVERAHERLIQR